MDTTYRVDLCRVDLRGINLETNVSFVIMSLSNFTVISKFVFSMVGANT